MALQESAVGAPEGPRVIVLDQDDVSKLYDWHGGQGSAVYSLASWGQNHRVSVDMIDEALAELRRDLRRERAHPNRDSKERADELEGLIDNLEMTIAAAEEDLRMDNPVSKKRVRELYESAKAAAGRAARHGATRAKEIAHDASIKVGKKLEELRAKHVRHIEGETCVCGKVPGRKDNPTSKRFRVLGLSAPENAWDKRNTWIELDSYASFEDARHQAKRIADRGEPTLIEDAYLQADLDAVGSHKEAVVWRSSGSEGHHRRDNPAPRGTTEEQREAGEQLAIAVTSEGELYPTRKAIEELLWKKMEKGRYSKERAPQAFAYYVEAGAKLLAKESNRSGDDRRAWFEQYPAAVRRVAAESIADSVESEMRIRLRERDETAETRATASPAEGGRRDNPVYPALGPAPDRKDNPTHEAVPLKLLQPQIGERLDNPTDYTSEELGALAVIASTKPSYRQERFERMGLGKYGPENKIVQELVSDGLVKVSKSGAVSLGPEARAVMKRHHVPEQFKFDIDNPTFYFAPRTRADNPLAGGCSSKTISENIRRELHAHPDMPVAQGVAIAYSHAREQGCKLPPRRRHNPTSDTQVADTILEQLGGMRMLSVMVGAKHFVALENGVQFSIGSGAKNGINKMRIVLRPSDTYDVEFWKIKGTNMKKVSEWEEVYNEDLKNLFEKETGMFLTLSPRRDNPAGQTVAS